MAGGCSVGDGIRRSPALCLGLQVDRPRHTRARCSAKAIGGFYRYVRNPMYLGFAVGWIGLWAVFGHANRVVIAAVAAVALAGHLFVRREL